MTKFSPTNAGLTMVTGGAWSGKTKYAASILRDHEVVTWIGTASRLDTILSDHVDRVASQRPSSWHTLESPLSLQNTMQSIRPDSTPVVIDSCNQWLANLAATCGHKYSATQLKDHLMAESDACLESLSKLYKIRPVIAITAEVGWSIAPESPIAAALRQVIGIFNQELARQANCVVLLCSGIDKIIKP